MYNNYYYLILCSFLFQEENYNLRTQLVAYENDLELVKIDLRTEVATRDDQIDTFKKTLSGMQQQLLTNAQKKREEDAKYADLAAKLKKLKDQNKKLLEKAKGGGKILKKNKLFHKNTTIEV